MSSFADSMWPSQFLYNKKTGYPCVSWLNNRCEKTELTCHYPHNKNGMPLCKRWVDGKCIGGHGNSCCNRHYYLEEDRQDLNETPSHSQTSRPTEEFTNFSSPLVVKVRHVKENHRREEIDLDTGRRRSYIETTTQEIVDLTGNATANESADESTPTKLFSADSDETTPMKTRKALQEIPINAGANLLDFDDGVCPHCDKKFKGRLGVKSHLSRPTSICGKKHKSCKQSTAQEKPKNTTSNDDSIILIE